MVRFSEIEQFPDFPPKLFSAICPVSKFSEFLFQRKAPNGSFVCLWCWNFFSFCHSFCCLNIKWLLILNFNFVVTSVLNGRVCRCLLKHSKRQVKRCNLYFWIEAAWCRIVKNWEGDGGLGRSSNNPKMSVLARLTNWLQQQTTAEILALETRLRLHAVRRREPEK